MTKEDTPNVVGDPAWPTLRLFDETLLLGLSARQRAVLAAATAWVPLVVLGAIQGFAWGPTRAESVLLDPAMFVRFLVSVPILILTPYACSFTLDEIARHFLTTGLVGEADRERFHAVVASAIRLRNARLANWICLALPYAYSLVYALELVPGAPPSWRTVASEGHTTLSLAGWWFQVVSQPMYHFVLLRFFYRTALWWQFLWRTSRLNLQLHAVHPDGAGGLGFLGLTLYAFTRPAFAISTSLAASMANLVLLTGVRVNDMWYVMLAAVILIVGLFAAPLSLFFFRELSRARHRGMLDYWTLAQAQFRQFDRKWMGPDSERTEMLTTGDFSQATDLHSILERAQNMTMLPFQPRGIVALVTATLFPFLPVVALEIPLLQILKALLGLAP